MSSPRVVDQTESRGVEARPRSPAVRPLLDVAFGFFVWALHLLAIYIATAIACQLGLGAASANTRRAFLTTLATVTMLAAVLVVLHGLRRYGQLRAIRERHFRMWVTVGSDAIAAIAIASQLLAVLLVPLCA